MQDQILFFSGCEVFSNPPAIITWKRGHESVPSTFTNADGILTISKMQFKDEGFYICSAENYIGIIIYLLFCYYKKIGNLDKRKYN